MAPSQSVLVLINSFAQSDSVGSAVYLICAASSADRSGSMLKLNGVFDLTTNWNSGLSIGICATDTQWIGVSILYL